ncbi:MAG: hypothetical protein OEU92_35060 [Alphaproteobacteria bacterium]|nr:hypothetical protein [Alphaproteobacteria bacterium]
MTTQKFLHLSLLMLLLIFAGSAQAFIGSIAVGLGQSAEFEKVKGPFSADAEFETEEGKFKSNIRYDDEKLLDVVNMGGQTMRTITRYDLKKSYTLMGEGMYMENDIGESDRAPEYEVREFEVVGEEVVNGQQTRKIKTLHESKDGKFGGFLWVNDNNVAVKGFMVSDDGKERQRILFNLTNYKAGPQPPESFNLPANAKPFSMPSFGDMAGMQGAPGAQGMQGNQTMPDMGGMKQMQQSQQYPQGNDGSDVMTDAAGAAGDPSDMSDPGLAGEAKEAADQGVTQGVKEGVFEESKNAAKGLINKGFGLFKK